jgi:hypothetical protein
MRLLRRILIESGAGVGSVVVGLAGWICSLLSITVVTLLLTFFIDDQRRRHELAFLGILIITTVWQVTYALLTRITAYRFRLSAMAAFIVGCAICVAGILLVVLVWGGNAINSSAEGSNVAIAFFPMQAMFFVQTALMVFPAVFAAATLSVELWRFCMRQGWPRILSVTAVLAALLVAGVIATRLMGLLMFILLVTDGGALPFILAALILAAIIVAIARRIRARRTA